MQQRILIALVATLGIALTGCSSMRSADSESGTSTGTMRRADSGSTSDSSSTSSRSSTSQPNSSGGTTNSGRGMDCTNPDKTARSPNCPPSDATTQPDTSSDTATESTPPR